MKRTLFVNDLKAKREFVWNCPLQEDVNSFVTDKIGHPNWELRTEVQEFEKGESVMVEDVRGTVEDVYKTPFLLKERKMIASQEKPIYKVKMGSGIAYVTPDRLQPYVPLRQAVEGFIQETDHHLLTEFFHNLLSRIPRTETDLVIESCGGIRERLDHILEGTNGADLYNSIMEVLSEQHASELLGTMLPGERCRLIEKLSSQGTPLPGVSDESGKLGLTVKEMELWEQSLGSDWKSSFMRWVDKGFSASESLAFARHSSSPTECAEMRDKHLSVEDFVHA
jgi:hypothetical protein